MPNGGTKHESRSATVNIGDKVLYGSNGVCTVADITENELGTYYILVPLHMRSTKISVPMKNETLVAKMRPIPRKKEATDALNRVFSATPYWEENESARRDQAKEILTSGDEYDLLLLVKSFHLHKQQTLEAGRKMHLADEGILKQGLKCLHEEYSAVFGIEVEEVEDFIHSMAEKTQSSPKTSR